MNNEERIEMSEQEKQIDDGGPAFPCECSAIDGELRGKQTGPSSGICTGLSMRDYFAAKALPVIYDNASLADEFDAIASDAYSLADAMLKARSK